MATARLRLVTPTIVNRTVTPRRPPNKDLRTREHLTEAEVQRLIKAIQGNGYGHRDATIVLAAYRHGLRAAELIDHWEQIDFRTATLHVRRVKQGTPSTRPILGDELRALRWLQREQEPRSRFAFTSERGAPFTTSGFARMIERAGKVAKLSFKAHHKCSGTPAGTHSPVEGMIRGRCKLTLATATSSTRRATPNCRPRGSRTSGGSEWLIR